MQLIDLYMDKEYVIPTDFEEYVYVSQLVQANGIAGAIDAHRRARPYCMGTLYWQLNDCWPVISWSSIDYKYNRKALHYFVRRSYDDLYLSITSTADSIEITAISDHPDDVRGTIDVYLAGFEGKKYWGDSSPIIIYGNANTKVLSMPTNSIGLDTALLPQLCLFVKFHSEEKELNFFHYFDITKNLDLPDPRMEVKIEKSPEGYKVLLNTENLAKNVFLSNDLEGWFEDNYFDIEPGGSREILFIPAIDSGNTPKVRVMTLFDIQLKYKQKQ